MCVVAGGGVSANVSGNGALNGSKTIKPLVFTDEKRYLQMTMIISMIMKQMTKHMRCLGTNKKNFSVKCKIKKERISVDL